MACRARGGCSRGTEDITEQHTRELHRRGRSVGRFACRRGDRLRDPGRPCLFQRLADGAGCNHRRQRGAQRRNPQRSGQEHRRSAERRSRAARGDQRRDAWDARRHRRWRKWRQQPGRQGQAEAHPGADADANPAGHDSHAPGLGRLHRNGRWLDRLRPGQRDQGPVARGVADASFGPSPEHPGGRQGQGPRRRRWRSRCRGRRQASHGQAARGPAEPAVVGSGPAVHRSGPRHRPVPQTPPTTGTTPRRAAGAAAATVAARTPTTITTTTSRRVPPPAVAPASAGPRSGARGRAGRSCALRPAR